MESDKTKTLLSLKEIGIDFPKGFIFTKTDWKDLYVTLREFKIRVLERRMTGGVEQEIESFLNTNSKRQ